MYRFVGPCVCVGVTEIDCLGEEEEEEIGRGPRGEEEESSTKA